MNLTFATDLGQTFTVEIDPSMELENVMALLEAEVIPKAFPLIIMIHTLTVWDSY
jgi:hypothetical protein